MTSSLCLNPEVHWITFHGGVDFGYILRALIGSPLPADEANFFDLMNAYFCNYYDVKEIKRDISHLALGGLSKLAKDLDVERIGTVHQAGSDSFVTSQVFFKLKEIYR
jgi:CCR4-NOT transcription complex subunit 7/8